MGGALSRTLILMLLVLVVLGALFAVLHSDEPGGPAAAAPRERTIQLAVEDGAMSPDEVEAGEGDRVNLLLTSDELVEVHLHGYDLEREIEPGETTTLSFEADLTGRFVIEDHESEEVLRVLLVQPR
jgi:hypothetical protein